MYTHTQHTHTTHTNTNMYTHTTHTYTQMYAHTHADKYIHMYPCTHIHYDIKMTNIYMIGFVKIHFHTHLHSV